jgi:hypothetical protein
MNGCQIYSNVTETKNKPNNHMQSPVAPDQKMERISIEDDLTAYRCPESQGIFLPIASYFRWLSRQPERLPHLPKNTQDEAPPMEESSGIKICPESGQIMMRYKVGHGFTFSLDRSPTGSIWFDKGEWEALRSRQFHDELHLIFTAPWQDHVRTKEKQEAEHQILAMRLGEDLLSQLNELKSTLSEHPHKEMALAYLQRP